MNLQPLFFASLYTAILKLIAPAKTGIVRKNHLSHIELLLALILIAGCSETFPTEVHQAFATLPERVDFNFHIRPILADRCFACHGPDNHTREAELRLDIASQAFARLPNSGGYALVGGRLDQSEVWKRIISEDPMVMMPPPESNLVLTPSEKAMIARWIEQGAEWKEHWAFLPPESSALPTNLPSEWRRNNPIDHFIHAKLLENQLVPSPEADRERIIRRLSFDLTGLPPTLEEIDHFKNDASPKAYENLVDRLLSSSAHAERLTMEWLDVSRYADSHGMHADGLRIMWRWRDWVIKSFERNQAYDEFVTWQIAGDLLPNATREQKLATGFYRNQPLNGELGIVGEEYRLKYVADRTNTTATAFLGLTMECASCHDHKFDPISQQQYYEFSAFFNNVKELGMIGNDLNFGPLLLLPDSTSEEKIAAITRKIEALESKKNLFKSDSASIKTYLKELKTNEIRYPTPLGDYAFDSFKEQRNIAGRTIIQVDKQVNVTANGSPEISEGKIGKAIRIDSDYDQIHIGGLRHFDLYDDFSAGAWVKIEKTGTFQSILGNIGDKNSGWRGWLFFLDTLNRPGLQLVHNLSHNYLHVVADESIVAREWAHVFFTYDGSATAEGIQLYIDGKEVGTTVLNNRLYKNILPLRGRNYQPDPTRSLRMGIGSKYLFSETDDGVFHGSFDDLKIFNQRLCALEVAAISQLPNSPEMMDGADGVPGLDYYLHRHHRPFQELNGQLEELRRQKYGLLDGVEEVMVMEEMPIPRKTFILNRGQYDDLGAEVSANTPSTIFPYALEYPKNRLGLAQWLFSAGHPLTARVAVNRYWQLIFGRGLVVTPHDFGIQGALPTHPALLDWLAVDFQQSGWNLRRLLKMMVMSATYRQSSVLTDELKERDQENIWLSRGPSHRLPMEMIRDNALTASGLLNPKVGGKSVKPYQPDGLWKEKNEFSGFLVEYEQDSGADLYRRSMYTFIRRTSPPPIMTTFDAPARDVCTLKRETTNTPLQALILLNDPQFVEAARLLAERLQKEGGDQPDQQLEYAFRLVCGRSPTDIERQLLHQQLVEALQKFRSDGKAVYDLLQVGEAPVDKRLDIEQTAAWSIVCNTILNFDEAYMKR